MLVKVLGNLMYMLVKEGRKIIFQCFQVLCNLMYMLVKGAFQILHLLKFY